MNNCQKICIGHHKIIETAEDKNYIDNKEMMNKWGTIEFVVIVLTEDPGNWLLGKRINPWFSNEAKQSITHIF